MESAHHQQRSQYPGYELVDTQIESSTTLRPFAEDYIDETDQQNAADFLDNSSESEPDETKDTHSTPAPRKLNKSLWGRTLQALFDVLIASIAVLFLVFGSLVYVHDGAVYERGSGSMADVLVEMSGYGPTIFPLLFAALVGNTMKTIATWKVQKEATVSFLEQLLGSQSISGAFLTQIRLRAFNTCALLIIVLWSLSPLGSQASYRVIRTQTAHNRTDTPITSLTAFPSSYLLDDEGSSWSSESYSYITLPWLASVASGRVLNSRNQDLWGNVRMPSIEYLTNRTDDYDTINITDTSNLTYFSLIGTPITTLPSAGNTSFTMSASYMNVDCPILQDISHQSNLTNFTLSSSSLPGGDTDCTWSMISLYNANVFISMPCDDTLNISTSGTRDARRLIYEANDGSGSSGWMHLECALSTTYVDTTFNCDGTSSTCSPTAVQRSADPPYSANWTILDQFGGSIVAEKMATLLVGAFPEAGIENTQTSFVTYLVDPDNAIQDTYNFQINSTTMTARDYGTRLSQLFNAIFMLGTVQGIIGSFPPDEADVPGSSFASQYQNITGTNTVAYDVILCSPPWLVVLVVASVVMFLAGVLGAILRFITLVPDMLGSVALAMLPNRFQGVVESQSTTLSATDWARNLRNLRVRLGDVDPTAEVGRVGLAAPIDPETVASVQIGRYYY